MVLSLAGHGEGHLIRAADDGHDGGLGQQRVETRGFESANELLRICVELFDAPGFVEDDLEGFVGSSGLRRRQGGRAGIRPSASGRRCL